MPHTDASKSQATNRTFAMPHTDTSVSDVQRKSSRGYDLLRALGSTSCDTTH